LAITPNVTPRQLKQPKTVRRASTRTAPRHSPAQPPHFAHPPLFEQAGVRTDRAFLPNHTVFTHQVVFTDRAVLAQCPLLAQTTFLAQAVSLSSTVFLAWIAFPAWTAFLAPAVFLAWAVFPPERALLRRQTAIALPARLRQTALALRVRVGLGVRDAQVGAGAAGVTGAARVTESANCGAGSALILADFREVSAPPDAAPPIPVAVGRLEPSPAGGPSIFRHDPLLSEARERPDSGGRGLLGVRKLLEGVDNFLACG
jgi:hypothetical protein